MNTELLCRVPLEQARCRERVRQLQALGSIGHFAAALIEAALRRADRAIIEGDEAAVRASLAELEAYGRCEPVASWPQDPPPPSSPPSPAAGALPLRRPDGDAFTARRPSAAVRAVPAVGRRPARAAMAA